MTQICNVNGLKLKGEKKGEIYVYWNFQIVLLCPVK